MPPPSQRWLRQCPKSSAEPSSSSCSPLRVSASSIPNTRHTSLITPEGERVEHPEYSPYIADLTDDDLRGFYRDQVLIRRFDAEATALQRQGELGLWASLLGQEAAQVGSGRALRPQDYAF